MSVYVYVYAMNLEHNLDHILEKLDPWHGDLRISLSLGLRGHAHLHCVSNSKQLTNSVASK